jgi:hypothetical protein
MEVLAKDIREWIVERGQSPRRSLAPKTPQKNNFARQPNHLLGANGRKLTPACLAVLVRATGVAFANAGAERLGHDALDGAGTAAAFGAAAEAAVNLACRARHVRSCAHRGADVVVGQHITGANDHFGMLGDGFDCARSKSTCAFADKERKLRKQRKNPLFQVIPNWILARLERV